VTCTVEGCDRDSRARGWCQRHWQRWRRTGNPTGSIPRGQRRDAWTHGSRRGYELGCRCFPCRIADNRYQRAWEQGRRSRIPAAEVAAHIRTLVASGWTLRSIADEAAVGTTTPWYIVTGRTKAVNSRTAAALFSLAPLGRTVLLDAGPLTSAIRRRGPVVEVLPEATDRRAFYRAERDGQVTDAMADRLAVRGLGLTLEELYGPNWDQEVAA
jgi:hypothetical protein